MITAAQYKEVLDMLDAAMELLDEYAAEINRLRKLLADGDS